MYQKRRKKEREDRRKNSHKLENQRKLAAANNCHNCKSYNRNKQNYTNPTFPNQRNFQNLQNNRINAYTESMKLWWRTYCTALQYHSEQRRHWLHHGTNLFDGATNESSLLQLYADEYETSSSEEEQEYDEEKEKDGLLDDYSTVDEIENAADDIDLEYLKFLEVTHKHREDLRLKREIENA